jgi:hypothetical protein
MRTVWVVMHVYTHACTSLGQCLCSYQYHCLCLRLCMFLLWGGAPTLRASSCTLGFLWAMRRLMARAAVLALACAAWSAPHLYGRIPAVPGCARRTGPACCGSGRISAGSSQCPRPAAARSWPCLFGQVGMGGGVRRTRPPTKWKAGRAAHAPTAVSTGELNRVDSILASATTQPTTTITTRPRAHSCAHGRANADAAVTHHHVHCSPQGPRAVSRPGTHAHARAKQPPPHALASAPSLSSSTSPRVTTRLPTYDA